METPELDKMLSVKDKSQLIGEFLDWVQTGKDFRLCAIHRHNEDCYGEYGKAWGTQCEMSDKHFYPVYENIESVLAEFFGVDLKKAEEEKRNILKSLKHEPN